MRKTLKLFFISLFLIAVAVGFFIYYNSWWYVYPGYHLFVYTPERYMQLKERLEGERSTLRLQVRLASPGQRKAAMITDAGAAFTRMITDSLIPFWYGTRWRFYGITDVPGHGAIACGYFVTTVLRDAGVNIDRSELAECASESMIRRLVDEKNIFRYSKVAVGKFLEDISAQGDGLYIVGLDKHTGFLQVKGHQTTFIHSSGRFPFCVIRENAAASKVLTLSVYRVAGKLNNERFLTSWLSGEKI